MASSFTPLTPLTAPPANGRGAPFRSLQVSSSAPQAPVQRLAEPARASVPATPSTTPTPSQECGVDLPSLDVERENGQITRIRLRCRCGEVLELECVS